MKKFYDYCFYRLYGIFLSKDTGRRMGFYTAIIFISLVEVNPIVLLFTVISGYKTSQVTEIIFNFIVLFLLSVINLFYFRRNFKNTLQCWRYIINSNEFHCFNTGDIQLRLRLYCKVLRMEAY